MRVILLLKWSVTHTEPNPKLMSVGLLSVHCAMTCGGRGAAAGAAAAAVTGAAGVVCAVAAAGPMHIAAESMAMSRRRPEA